jgi:hypothetical protein
MCTTVITQRKLQIAVARNCSWPTSSAAASVFRETGSAAIARPGAASSAAPVSMAARRLGPGCSTGWRIFRSCPCRQADLEKCFQPSRRSPRRLDTTQCPWRASLPTGTMTGICSFVSVPMVSSNSAKTCGETNHYASRNRLRLKVSLKAPGSPLVDAPVRQARREAAAGLQRTHVLSLIL